MTVQIVNLSIPEIFKRYSFKYNIFRDLFEKDLIGIEIRDVDYHTSKKVKKIILNNKEICLTTNKNEKENCDLLALGSFAILKELGKEIIALGNEDLGLKISKTIQNVISYNELPFSINGTNYPLNKSYTLGILNITPDSFSDGGKYFLFDKAVEHGLALLEKGADILDIGGESTRPGSSAVSEEEELKRVIPVIEKILSLKPEAILSIDTSKSAIAKEALAKGAKIVNDISGFTFDPNIIKTVKEFNAACILMHIQGLPNSMQNNPYYEDVVSTIYDDLTFKVENARKHGIKNIIIDPGIGFGKRVKDNYEIINRLSEFKGIGQPILIGLSNKSFLGKSLNLEVNKREIPSLISETIAVKNGARFIRTHFPENSKFASKLNYYFEYSELLND